MRYLKKNRNKKKEYNVFLYGLRERTIFVLIELKCCGDYLAGESRTFNHLNLLFEERTREKIQVMEFQCDNGKHEWWTVLFVHILKKSTPVFYIISCIFDCFISAHLPSLDLLPFPFFWPCLSLLSCKPRPSRRTWIPTDFSRSRGSWIRNSIFITKPDVVFNSLVFRTTTPTLHPMGYSQLSNFAFSFLLLILSFLLPWSFSVWIRSLKCWEPLSP